MVRAISFEDWHLKKVGLFETLWIAALYIISARLGQILAIEPGNVTPVWIPSGLMVALALQRGSQIWLGVFLGAFAGNIWAYFSFETFSHILASIAAATMNGVGDVMSTVLMASLITAYCQTNYPFTSLKNFSIFILLSVILGSFISAFIGTLGLSVFNFLTADKVTTTFITWLVGDGVGALIFGPLVLSWLRPFKERTVLKTAIITALVIASGLITAFIFGLFQLDKWIVYLGTLLLPIMLIVCVSYEQKLVFSIQATVSLVAVYATSNGFGPFILESANFSLLQLQVFVAVFSLIIYVIALNTNEKKQLTDSLLRKKQELEKLYRLDQLTGLWNRFRIKEFIAYELERYKRDLKHFGLLMIDIDDFKKINDSYGHSFGDRVLVTLTNEIGKKIRSSDLFGRWGGEEFLIVSPNRDRASALDFAEKIRHLVEQLEFENGKKITVSIGATLNRSDDSELLLVDRVDEALYKSKSENKNKVSFI